MGLLDYLLFGALMNSLRNNSDNNGHSDYSNRDYDQGNEDDYSDGCMNHDDYHCNGEYDSSDSCDCGCDDFFYF